MEDKEIKYDQLVNDLREVILGRYGSVAAFTRHQDFLNLGYAPQEAAKVAMYFSKPKGEVPRRVKSAGFMAKLAAHYLDRVIVIRTLMRKKQVLISKK